MAKGITFVMENAKEMTSGLKTSLRDSAPLLSMLFSMALLIVLQFLWLAGSWREARESFRKETNHLFRSTVFAMHDSLVMRNIEPVEGDSTLIAKRFVLRDSVKGIAVADTSGDECGVEERSSVAEIYVARRDSFNNLIRPLSRRLRMDKTHRRFLVHMGPDSLDTDSIAVHFATTLSASGISVPFAVKQIRRQQPGRTPRMSYPDGVLVSDPVPFNPMTYYVAHFSSPKRFLLKAIAPQIFFSVFLTLLTAGSFALMYRSIRSQRKLVEMKDDLIGNISHELKTPVSTVSVALEAMERFKVLDDRHKTNEYLTMARNELNRLALMTDKILQTALFQNRMPEMGCETMDMDLAISGVLRSLKLVFEKRKVELLYTREGSDFTIHGSPSHLVTVVYNLLDNALKYSSESSVISVQLRDEMDRIVLSVEDKGIGIPEVYQKKIFEKFFRVPSGNVHNIKGYGLGLSYVARVIERHQGTIKVESEVDKGTVFHISLPKNATLK